jgi:tyrosine-protein kinase Etk/Wzc
VILTGDVPAQVSPLRLFELKNFPTIIEELKARYDLIVFDTAPVGLVSDALLIGSVVDGAVGVLRAERTSRRAARNIAKQLHHNRIPFIGWILNDVRESELRSAHRYGYGYGYGYGYYPRAHTEDGPAT